MSASERRKGVRVETEIVNAHKAAGIHAERYPLSGASHYKGSGHDVDIYPKGWEEDAPLVAEVKARKGAKGFILLENWLGEYDALFLKRDRKPPLVVIPWALWMRLIGGTGGAIPNKAAKTGVAEEPAQGAEEATP
jgi:hypothetical protein